MKTLFLSMILMIGGVNIPPVITAFRQVALPQQTIWTDADVTWPILWTLDKSDPNYNSVTYMQMRQKKNGRGVETNTFVDRRNNSWIRMNNWPVPGE